MHLSIKRKLKDICLLCEELDIQELSFFGSSVNGKFVEGKSDIDCFVKTRPEDIRKVVQLEFKLRKMFNTKIDIFHAEWELHPEIKEYIENNKLIVFQAKVTVK